MSATILHWVIIGVISLEFIVDQYLDYLNNKRLKDPVPETLNDIYDDDSYAKQQAYNKEKSRFSDLTSVFSFVILISFLLLDGFAFVDEIARTYTDNTVLISLVFFGLIFIANDLISIPFDYYATFVIEEKYGFNKMTKTTFMTDKLKGYLLGIIIGGGILALLILFYQQVGSDFWWYAWILISLFSILMNMFYARLIVPLFNKQKPLEDGDLKNKIQEFAQKTGFQLKNVFVIDGSKRSTKANAYFSGFGREKRITLYDTLINDLNNEEIVAVLAHEIGHYKKNHIIVNLVISILVTGFTLWLLSLFIDNPVLAEALGVEEPSFHIGLVAFGILYSPISTITGLLMNILSRKFEYQADDFAKQTYNAQDLINALKKLTRKSFSNLTPHPAYVFMNYSHPSLYQRVKAMEES
ncbi:MAG: M48 family metallopeptidase [Psychroflexus sp.]|nr:M48 family metallopeptidase [Psychroflexus sp.]MDR9448687.1 M48 family metallopeptidase [Psychroflexus sp.]